MHPSIHASHTFIQYTRGSIQHPSIHSSIHAKREMLEHTCVLAGPGLGRTTDNDDDVVGVGVRRMMSSADDESFCGDVAITEDDEDDACCSLVRMDGCWRKTCEGVSDDDADDGRPLSLMQRPFFPLLPLLLLVVGLPPPLEYESAHVVFCFFFLPPRSSSFFAGRSTGGFSCSGVRDVAAAFTLRA